MKKILVILSLFICCAMGLYAQGITTDWEDRSSTIYVDADNHCKLTFTYSFRINNGIPEVIIISQTYEADAEHEAMCSDLIMNHPEMINDMLVKDLIFREQIFNPYFDIIMKECPNISFEFARVFAANCATGWIDTGMQMKWFACNTEQQAFCAYIYKYCLKFDPVTRNMETFYTRTLEAYSTEPCNIKYHDAKTNNDYPCHPIGCWTDIQIGIKVPTVEDLHTHLDDGAFFGR